jgi:hypothetical protein
MSKCIFTFLLFIYHPDTLWEMQDRIGFATYGFSHRNAKINFHAAHPVYEIRYWRKNSCHVTITRDAEKTPVPS